MYTSEIGFFQREVIGKFHSENCESAQEDLKLKWKSGK
jgi:hypothetical protein